MNHWTQIVQAAQIFVELAAAFVTLAAGILALPRTRTWTARHSARRVGGRGPGSRRPGRP